MGTDGGPVDWVGWAYISSALALVVVMALREWMWRRTYADLQRRLYVLNRANNLLRARLTTYRREEVEMFGSLVDDEDQAGADGPPGS